MNRKALFAVALLIALAAVFMRKYSAPTSTDNAPNGGLESTLAPATSLTTPTGAASPSFPPAPNAIPSPAAISDTSPAPRPSSSAAPRVHALHPLSTAAYRAEVARDPESPPPSMMRFAAELGTRMEDAMKSEESAKQLLPDLEDCALGHGNFEAIASAQAVCLSAARKLGKRYPNSDLSDRAERLTQSSDPRVQRLISILPESQR